MCSSAVAVPHSRESLCFDRCAAPPSLVGRTGRQTADQQTDHNHSDTSGARTDGRSIGQTPVMYPSPRCQWHQNRKGQCPAWFSSPVARIGSAYTQGRGNSTEKNVVRDARNIYIMIEDYVRRQDSVGTSVYSLPRHLLRGTARPTTTALIYKHQYESHDMISHIMGLHPFLRNPTPSMVLDHIIKYHMV
jgi:hypothetical protein